MTKDNFIPPFMEETLKAFKQLNYPTTDMDNIMNMYKKNIELMNSTQQIAIEATKAMMDLQRSYFQKAFEQYNSQLKAATTATSFEEKKETQTDATKNTVNQTLDTIQEMNEIVAKSSEKINQSFQKRFKESLDEASNITKNPKKKS